MLILTIVVPNGREGIFGGVLGAHFHDPLAAPLRQFLFPRPRPRNELWLNDIKILRARQNRRKQIYGVLNP